MPYRAAFFLLIAILLASCGDLHFAVRFGNAEMVSEYAARTTNINATNSDGHTAVHLAAIDGRTDALLALLEKRAGVNIANPSGWTALHYTADKGYDSIARVLLVAGANPGMQDRDGMAPLHIAAKNGSLSIVRILVGKGASVYTTNRLGETPLHLAASHGNLDIIRFLALDARAEMNARDHDRRIPYDRLGLDLRIFWHTVLGNLDGVVSVLDFFNIHSQDRYGNTAMHYAAFYNYLEIARYLAVKGSETSRKNRMKRTPLHLAAINGSLDVLKFLVQSGCPVAIADADGLMPHHLAAQYNHPGSLRFLAGLDSNFTALRDSSMRTPLHLAALNDSLECSRFLLESGPVINSMDLDGRTALHCAAVSNSVRTLDTLLNYRKPVTLTRESVSTVTNMTNLVSMAVLTNETIVTNDMALEITNLNITTNELFSNTVEVMVLTNREPVAGEDRKFNIQAMDNNGFSPLHLAVLNGSVEAVRVLLAQKADRNAKDRDGRIPLFYARNAEIIRLLAGK